MVPHALTPSPRRTPPTADRRPPTADRRPAAWPTGCLADRLPGRPPTADRRLPAAGWPLGWRRFDGGGGGWLLL